MSAVFGGFVVRSTSPFWSCPIFCVSDFTLPDSMVSLLFISLCSAWFGSSVLQSHSLSGIFSLSHGVMQQDSVYLRTRFLMQMRVLVISGGLKADFMEFGIGLARPIVLKCSCRYLLHVGFDFGGFSIMLKRGLSWVRVEGGGKGFHGFRDCCSIPFDCTKSNLVGSHLVEFAH